MSKAKLEKVVIKIAKKQPLTMYFENFHTTDSMELIDVEENWYLRDWLGRSNSFKHLGNMFPWHCELYEPIIDSRTFGFFLCFPLDDTAYLMTPKEPKLVRLYNKNTLPFLPEIECA